MCVCVRVHACMHIYIDVCENVCVRVCARVRVTNFLGGGAHMCEDTQFCTDLI